jgi:hypothetical protein
LSALWIELLLETHFIAALIVQHIKEIGEGRVFVVCMDGARKFAFVLIQKEFPWVKCFVCPAYAIDGFLKNVGSSTESIRMQVNVMGDVPASEMEWNESFFRDCFDNVSKMVTWIAHKKKPFARFQTIDQELIKERKNWMWHCDVQECGDKVCVASFNDGKGHAEEQGIQDSCQ